MAGRIVVVLIVLCFGGFVLYTRTQAEKPPIVTVGPGGATGGTTSQADKFNDPNVVGVEPETEPVFNVEVDLTMNGQQPNLNFVITEQHGWYAGEVSVQFWYVKTGDDGNERQVGAPITTLCRNFLPFNGTLEHKTTPIFAEFPDLSEWGTSENWRARVLKCGKVLAPAN